MYLRWLTLFLLLVLPGTGCNQRSAQVATLPAAETVEIVEEFWPDGRLMLRKQVVGQPDGTRIDHGTFERWHKNGRKEYEAVFDHGKKEGTTVRYHQNGQRSTQQEYRNGLRHGSSVSWNSSGEKVKQENWSAGRPHGNWTVWKHGQIQWQQTYEHGLPVDVAQADERE